MADDFGRLFLRLGIGVLLLFHGVHTLLTGLEPLTQLIADHHLPVALAYYAYAGEIVAPVLLLLGVFSRIGAFLIVVEVAALVALGGLAQAISIAPDGGYALEIEALYLAGALAILLLGPGKIAVAKGKYQ